MKAHPTAAVATGLLATGLAFDVVLIRNGHEAISTWVRARLLCKAVVIYLAAHLCVRLPADPLRLIAERLSRTR